MYLSGKAGGAGAGTAVTYKTQPRSIADIYTKSPWVMLTKTFATPSVEREGAQG